MMNEQCLPVAGITDNGISLANSQGFFYAYHTEIEFRDSLKF